MFVWGWGSLCDCRYWFYTQIWFYLSENWNTRFLHPQTPNCLTSFTTIFSWLKNKQNSRRGNWAGSCMAGRSACPGQSRRCLDVRRVDTWGPVVSEALPHPHSLAPSRREMPSHRWWCLKVSLKQGESSRIWGQGGGAVWNPWGLYPQLFLDPPATVCGAGWGSEGWGGPGGGRSEGEWCLRDWKAGTSPQHERQGWAPGWPHCGLRAGDTFVTRWFLGVSLWELMA